MRVIVALVRRSTPTLTSDTCGHARNEGLAEVVETVADRVLFGKRGANMMHENKSDITPKFVKLLPEHQLAKNLSEWRRGDSKPKRGGDILRTNHRQNGNRTTPKRCYGHFYKMSS